MCHSLRVFRKLSLALSRRFHYMHFSTSLRLLLFLWQHSWHRRRWNFETFLDNLDDKKILPNWLESGGYDWGITEHRWELYPLIFEWWGFRGVRDARFSREKWLQKFGGRSVEGVLCPHLAVDRLIVRRSADFDEGWRLEGRCVIQKYGIFKLVVFFEHLQNLVWSSSVRNWIYGQKTLTIKKSCGKPAAPSSKQRNSAK